MLSQMARRHPFLWILLYGLLWWFSSKESAFNVGERGLIPGSGRSPGRGKGNPLQYSCLENPMNRGAWWASPQASKESDTTEATQQAGWILSYTTSIFSFVDGHLGCSHNLAIENNAMMNMVWCIYLWKLVSCALWINIQNWNSWIISVCNFLKNLHNVFCCGCTYLYSHQQYMRVPSDRNINNQIFYLFLCQFCELCFSLSLSILSKFSSLLSQNGFWLVAPFDTLQNFLS